MKRIIKSTGKLLAGLSAAAGLLTLTPFFALNAAARTEQTLIGYAGDITQDLQVDINDVVEMQNYLTSDSGYFHTDCMDYADLCEDGVLDARDLTLLKRLLLERKEPLPLFREIEIPEEPISPPIRAVKPTLGSVGEQKILMVSVEFPDCKNEKDYTREEIFDIAFGPANERSRSYPLESITAYYERSSYGRLHLTGDVYKYTAKKNLKEYEENSDTLVDEIMKALDPEINYNNYDAATDSVLDTLLMALPAAANPDMLYDSPWWPCSYQYSGWKRYDGVRAGNICMGAWPLYDRSGFNSTWVHELGHAMGLPDYYYYENPIGNGDGLPGEAGYAMMDEAMGDMTAFDKLMYGWYTTDNVHIYEGGTQTFRLESSQDAPGCIIIPRGELDGYLSEFFILEYITDTGNNARGFSGKYTYTLFEGSGVRVLHCDSEVCEGWWGPELKWNNYGYYYDNSNLKQRVLRIVDSKHGLFRQGSSISSARSGFQWYDNNGDQKIDPGVIVEINEIKDGFCTITIRDSSDRNAPENTNNQNAEQNGEQDNTNQNNNGWPWGGWGSWGGF